MDNKLVRTLLLQFPALFSLLYYIKNNYLIYFYLKKVTEPDFNALKLIFNDIEDNEQLFLDIGANAGMSALSIYTLIPNAKVISFEPNPFHEHYLNKLVDKFPNYQFLPIGLGNESKSIYFYFPIYNGKKMTANGSCSHDLSKSYFENTIYFFDDRKLKMEKIKIEVKTLDSFQLKPDFIKIDVEGFEYQVLLGSADTINKSRPVLLIEGVSKNDKIHQKLQEWKYNAYKFHNNKFYLDEFDCCNNFFLPQEKLELIQYHLN
ncbi:MAG: FkbM family methyltransferase [Xenococcus sp. (in: cyanobacteria)]